jgi:hypothetical protein
MNFVWRPNFAQTLQMIFCTAQNGAQAKQLLPMLHVWAKLFIQSKIYHVQSQRELDIIIPPDDWG